MADYTNYTNKEMQAVTIAKQIKKLALSFNENPYIKEY